MYKGKNKFKRTSHRYTKKEQQQEKNKNKVQSKM